jgi:hypothetical protein
MLLGVNDANTRNVGSNITKIGCPISTSYPMFLHPQRLVVMHSFYPKSRASRVGGNESVFNYSREE